MKITHYTTAYGNTPRELDEAVKRHLADGWQPFGSPYATDNPIPDAMEPQMLAQAMVKSAD